MKKRIYVLAVMIAAFFLGVGQLKKDDGKFHISQTYVTVGGGYVNTRIRVIVYEKGYDTDTMFDDVRNYYAAKNGEPDQLTIWLYDSRKGFKKHNCREIRVYYKEDIRRD